MRAVCTAIEFLELYHGTSQIVHKQRQKLFTCMFVFSILWSKTDWRTTSQDCPLLLKTCSGNLQTQHAQPKSWLWVGELAEGNRRVSWSSRFQSPCLGTTYTLDFHCRMLWEDNGETAAADYIHQWSLSGYRRVRMNRDHGTARCWILAET